MAGRVIQVDHGFVPVLEDDYQNSSADDCRLVLLSSRDVTVIRSMLVPASWPTRFGSWVSSKLFRVADNGGLIELLEELECKLMSCDISDSLNNIANAIASLRTMGCNQCEDTIKETNGGVNGNLPDGTPTYGSVPYSDYPASLPVGYDSHEQFDTQRCGIAHLIVDGMVYTLKSLAGVGTVQAIGSTLLLVVAVVGLLVIPEVVIPTLITGIAVLWAASGTLLGLSVAVESHRSDIVCLLVEGENLETTIGLLSDLFDSIVAEIPLTGPVGTAAKMTLMTLVSADTLNQLYADYVGFAYPDADCDDCSPVVLVINNGTLTSGDLKIKSTNIVDSIYGGAFGVQQEMVQFATVGSVLYSVTVDMEDTGGHTSFLSEWLDELGVYHSEEAQSFPWNVVSNSFNLYSRPENVTGTFTVSVVMEEYVE